ncbi:metallophosphoesterase [Paraburkholderia aromaticivorans]|uniref:metallophosphoesterase n=1 Tax=Paraburkholderia aromaticivorans TaxID=2026199 RepID=UPI001456095F|nr:metallophosphoesterase [Paraburkholderia aromaticivorans]
MRKTLFVISDLHLGGAPGTEEARGFQITPPRTQTLLARFIDGLPGRSPECDVRLVIAGDIVDFLAEEPFQAFTGDPQAACAKLDRILAETAPVWEALKRFIVNRDGAVTLMLGNHDIELALPGPRQLLLDAIGPGRIEFIYDNEAFTCGPVLIEHGNRFDEWNAVPHGALRRARSQLSRALPLKPEFPALPGSRLVVDVMNPLKRQYPFVDLLKPEDAGALPIVAALGAAGIRDVWQFFQKYRQTWAVDYDENREPLGEEYISSGDQSDQKMFDLAQDIASGGDLAQINAASDILRGVGGSVTELVREGRREALFKAIRASAAKHRLAFEVGEEVAPYLSAARTASASGFEVVVYGHTHLVKRVGLSAGNSTFPVYLNTGTWADLMRMPDSIWGTEDSARKALMAFVADLESSSLDQWRRAVPTYAKIEVDSDAVLSADVYFADGDADEPASTAGLSRRLAGGPAHA